MNKRCLICIDMQNDFLTGSLSNPDAQRIIPFIKNELKYGNYDHVVFTRDTHSPNYLFTPEGKNLPIEHCIKHTWGWDINKELLEEATFSYDDISFLDKPTFGTLGLLSHIQSCGDFKEVVFVGVCTDICVISNAIILKTMKPELEISVLANGCAGLTKEKHYAALDVMESCQINVVRK